MPAFTVVTLGCKVNQYDSAGIAQALTDRGWVRADAHGLPDVCIINTCTVTAGAAMQARQAVRHAIRAYPESRILVTGCYAQTDPEAVAAIEGVDFVVGNTDKHRIVDQLCNIASTAPQQDPPISSPAYHHMPVTVFSGRSRPFLKIQDGCNSRCTYCIVPRARGVSRSLGPDQVLDGLRRLGDAGYREVVLTGIHLGTYGPDLNPPMTLSRLLERIIAEAPVDRIRISSIEPNEVTDALLDAIGADPMICPHLHIPLQSGDDGILRRMNRPYPASLFAERVLEIVQRMPDTAIGADVLVGFPGEDDAAADATHALIDALPLAYLHVFPFSPRPGTPAAGYPNPVPGDIVRRRCQRLRALGAVKRDRFRTGQSGQIRPVLVEARRNPRSGLLVGMSDNYIRVLLDGPDAWMGRMLPVQLMADGARDCTGRVITDRPPSLG